MKHKYNIPDLLLSVVGYKGLPYPGALAAGRSGAGRLRQELLKKGTRLYKQDALGRWYFMPVVISYGKGDSLELQNAVISLTQNKKIIQTDLVNRRGSVKELISIEDFQITIGAFIQSDDGSYPEQEISRMRDLFQINESVELVSALTDLLFDKDDKVVITEIAWPSTPGVEDGQAVTLKCRTDTPFELIIK